MKMFVVRAGEESQHIALNLDREFACVGFQVPIDLKHTHDLHAVLQALEDYARTSEAEGMALHPGYKTEAGRRTRAVELLTFAHDIKRGDLVFTPDSRPKFRNILVGKVIEPYLYWPSKYTTDLLDGEDWPIFHILEKVAWHKRTLPRDKMPETICSPGHAKKGVDQRWTVFEIKDPESRRDLLEEMRKRHIEL
jgi:predicted Mrr-cat superfamily restriction endonuclease